MFGNRASRVLVHAALLSYAVIAVFPVLLVVMNSFKDRRGIFAQPLAPPTPETFSMVGFRSVFEKGDLPLYFGNSLVVTVASLFLVVLLGAMAAWALTEYRFRWSTLLGLYMAIGIMVPIRLGTVSILNLMVDLNLVNTLTALVLVYTAQGLPLSVFILAEFISQIPRELREAARCDGVPERAIFARVILPLLRPAMATVAVFTMVPIWNDLWFPLILAPTGGKQTITLGVQQFIGQYLTDWNAVLASLSLAILPILVLYLIFSRQLIRGLTSGAVK
jgi:raffinose/stachyose/melibiose transport system permease protein